MIAVGCAGCTATPTTTPTAPSRTTAPSTAVGNCGVAPRSLVGAVLGVPAGGPRQFNLGRGVIQCLYTTDVGKPAVLRFYNNVNAASFATLEAAVSGHGQAVTNIRFQDEAFTSTTTGALVLNSLYARKGSLVIAVVSVASLGAEKALETQIFAR